MKKRYWLLLVAVVVLVVCVFRSCSKSKGEPEEVSQRRQEMQSLQEQQNQQIISMLEEKDKQMEALEEEVRILKMQSMQEETENQPPQQPSSEEENSKMKMAQIPGEAKVPDNNLFMWQAKDVQEIIVEGDEYYKKKKNTNDIVFDLKSGIIGRTPNVSGTPDREAGYIVLEANNRMRTPKIIYFAGREETMEANAICLPWNTYYYEIGENYKLMETSSNHVSLKKGLLYSELIIDGDIKEFRPYRWAVLQHQETEEYFFVIIEGFDNKN